jgi:hypothetical protein
MGARPPLELYVTLQIKMSLLAKALQNVPSKVKSHANATHITQPTPRTSSPRNSNNSKLWSMQ